MTTNASPFSTPLSRRQFGIALGGLYCSSLCRIAGSEPRLTGPWSGPARVAKVYLAADQVHWPSPAYDVVKGMAEIETRLAEVERQHAAELRFTSSKLLRQGNEIEAWAGSLGEVDAVLAIPLSAPQVSIVPVIDAARVPVLCLSLPYASHTWSGIARLREAGRKVDLLASSNYRDLDAYVPVFKAVRHLKRSKVLVVTNRPSFSYVAPAKGFTEHFGTRIEMMKLADLKPVFESAEVREAQRQADALVRGARRVVEPTPKEILDAMRFYLGLRTLLEKEQANAISIDCFPAVVDKTLPAYPCIAWSKLNDQGLYGVCQADVRATMTQLLVTSYSGMPGFVSNPVFDTSRNLVIHAHCVAATRMLGLGARPAPYLIRNHLETNEGAVLQVIMPTGKTVTVAQFSDAKRLLASTAKAIGTTADVHGNPDADYGCRTKLHTRVNNAAKWVDNYETAVHRVVFYGDHLPGLERMGRLMGFSVVKEG